MKPLLTKAQIEQAKNRAETYGKPVYVSESLTRQIRMGFSAPKPESTMKEILIFKPQQC